MKKETWPYIPIGVQIRELACSNGWVEEKKGNEMKKDIIAFMVQAKFQRVTALLAKMKSAQTIEHGASVAEKYEAAMQDVCNMMLEHKELLELSDNDIEKVRKEMK